MLKSLKVVSFLLMFLVAFFANAAKFNYDYGDFHEYEHNYTERPSIMLGAWSKHLSTVDYTNEKHDLIAIEYKGAVGGYFENSYGRDTVFVGKFMEKQVAPTLRVFFILGAMHGYTKCYGEDNSSKNVCAMFSFGMSFSAYRVQPSIFMLGDAVAGGFRYQF